MQIASVVSTGKPITWVEGVFAIDGQGVGLSKIAVLDSSGDVAWVSPDVHNWFRGLLGAESPPPGEPRQPSSFLTRPLKINRKALTGLALSAALWWTGVIVYVPIAGMLSGRGSTVQLPQAFMLMGALWLATWFLAGRRVLSDSSAGWRAGFFGLRLATAFIAPLAAALIVMVLIAWAGNGSSQVVGVALPPSSVLVDGKAYYVTSSDAGTVEILRGDKVLVELVDVDNDGTDDVAHILSLESVAQEKQ